jgi:outer membrane protein TolC
VRQWCDVFHGGTTSEAQSMNRSLFKLTAYLQLGLAIVLATGCAQTQPFFANESPDLQYYLNTATRIEYPDVEVESLAETTQAQAPLTIGNHDYQFWDLTLEECVSMALNNAKFFVTTSGNAEFRQNVAAQFTSASADQLGSIYDIAIQQSTTQSIPLTIDGSGNRTLPRGVLRANQVGGVEDALAEFDAQTSGFVNFTTTDRPRNTGSSQVSVQQAQGKDITQQSAISKRFATGGIATLRQQFSYAQNNLPASLLNVNNAGRIVGSDWTAILEAEVQHPLWRNRGTMVNRIPVVLASLNEDIAITDFEIQVRNLVRDVEVAYWNLYVAYRNVSTTIIGRNSAMATAKFAKLRLEQGTGTQQDLSQAELQYYAFRAQLEGALAGSNVPGDGPGVYGSERTMRELLGLAPTDGRLIRPIDEPNLARVEFDWDEAIVQMLYLSPEMRRAKTVIKQRELEQVSAKNQIVPEVNLSLLYRMVGVGDELGGRSDVNFPLPGSSAIDGLTNGDHQEGQVRLEITPPAIGSRREQARIRGSQFRLVQSRAYLQDAERLLVSQLSDAVSKTATHYQLVQTQAQRWQAAEQEVEGRLAEYQGGRAEINVVLQSQQRRADAQIAYYRALGEYNKSINYVDYLKGTMLANNNIVLAEGPWNKKAYWDALERARERSAGKKVKYGVTRPGVVRRGPLGETASNDAADRATTFGETMPPEGVIFDESNASLSDMNLDGVNMEPHRESVEVNDIPLEEMGTTPDQMLDPTPNKSTPNKAPEVLPDTIQLPSPDSLPDEPVSKVVPINYESGVGVSNAPIPVRKKPLPVQ